MKMTLSEALCDDLTALQVGWLQLLPKVDASGRQMLYFEPARHKREGYTSESLVSTTSVSCFSCVCSILYLHCISQSSKIDGVIASCRLVRNRSDFKSKQRH